VLSELCQVLEGLQESFLNRVLGIFPVMCDALSDSEKFAIVPLYELLEGGNFSTLAGVDKIEIVASRFAHYELCRVYSHIRALDAAKRRSPTLCPRPLEICAHCTTTLPVIFGWIVQ
jgi:hypothetical protein